MFHSYLPSQANGSQETLTLDEGTELGVCVGLGHHFPAKP